MVVNVAAGAKLDRGIFGGANYDMVLVAVYVFQDLVTK